MNYFIIVYGCQMNKSDSERIRAVLNIPEFQEVKKESEADLIILVACSIRGSAINRIYGKIPNFNKYKKNNPNLKTIITGCILSKDKKLFKTKLDFILDIKDIKKIPDLVSVNSNPPEVTIPPKIISDKNFIEGVSVKNINQKNNYLKITPKQTSTFSAVVPVMTGCNNYCTYCVVPYVRGNKISRPVADILNEIQNLINNNYKEIWLLGQNVNDYDARYNKKKYNFPALLKEIDQKITISKQKIWVRFTSPHPKNFSDELIDVIANGKNITNYINLPMQSGDNDILRKMNRGYTIEEYNTIIKKIKKKIPTIALSTDLILGFSGESKKKFQNTIKAVKKNKFDMIYINQYSVRTGTAAEKFGDTVTKEEKKNRWNILNALLKELSYEKNQKYLNKNVEILVDSLVKGNYLGKTRDYKTVKIVKQDGCHPLIGEFMSVKIIEVQSFGMKGEIVKLET